MTILPLLAQLGTVNPQSGNGLAPHWGWYVILYFFLGGLSAGSYFIATMLALTGDSRDRETVRLGYMLAFPLVVACGILLVIDLGVPLRFWHMLIQSERPPLPIFKWWSPMSLGSWVLMAFSLFSFVSFVGVLVETGRVRWSPAVRLDRWARSTPRPLAVSWAVVGTFFGFFLAGYTGVLLTGTSIAVWHNARLLGGIFLASAASTSYALLILLLLRRGRTHAEAPVAKLASADKMMIVLELLLLALMLIVLGGVARPFIRGGFGVVFWLGVVVLGLLVPLALHLIPRLRWDAHRRTVVASMCVLVGGLILRFVIVMAPQWPSVRLWAL